jgi:HSP20 family protein
MFNRVGFQAKLNVSSDDKQYHVSLEAPGLTEKEISLELNQGVLTIRGEKKEENETKDRHYYRMERSYGSFQRVLALPEDCDQEGISASMKNGVLDITLPRKALPASAAKQIPIN